MARDVKTSGGEVGEMKGVEMVLCISPVGMIWGGLLRIPFHLNCTNLRYAKSKKDFPEFYVLMIFFPYATIPHQVKPRHGVNWLRFSINPVSKKGSFMTDLAILKDTLHAHGQAHLLAFYDQLTPSHRDVLCGQLEALDFDQIDTLIDTYVKTKAELPLPADMQPPSIIPANGGEQAVQARARGEAILAAGKVAVFTVAGGQGTRLGYEGPKGCYPCTPVAEKPLFRVFAEQIRAAANRYNVSIPWYILTSPVNDTATQAHFRQNDYWGFDPKDVIFVVQGTMPSIDLDGKLMLARPYRLAVNPDGHGGALTALHNQGALTDMKARGIEQVSYFQVDNPLVKCVDPLFLGLHDLANAQASAKALPKREPLEKLGNFCLIDNRVNIIEYSDLPDELAYACNADGRLRFSAGSISINLFRVDFIEHLTAHGPCKLPWHRADKKVPYVNAAGETVTPETPNAVKLEMFVFDAMPFAERVVLLETSREEEFSPIKNKQGPDSPATSKHDQIRRAAGWLEEAGVDVPRDAEGQIAAAIEISPLYADSADELAKQIARQETLDLSIKPGQSLYLGSKGQLSGS